MDRNLAIALTLAALAAMVCYGMAMRLREGFVQFKFRNFYRNSEPGTYWTIIAILALMELGLAGLALRYLVAWL